MTEQEALPGGTWLRVLSGLIIVLILVSLVYACVIGLINFQRIGV